MPMPSFSATRSAAALVGIERAMPGKPLGIAGRQMGVGGQHRQRIRRRDEDARADDQIAVAVAIRRGAEIGRVRRHHHVIEVLGMDEVGIGMMAAEIRQRHAVDDGARRRAERLLEDLLGIGAGDRMHGVEAHAEARVEQCRGSASKSNSCLHQRLHSRRPDR